MEDQKIKKLIEEETAKQIKAMGLPADGKDGATGPMGPQGPAGPAGPQGPAGAATGGGLDGKVKNLIEAMANKLGFTPHWVGKPEGMDAARAAVQRMNAKQLQALRDQIKRELRKELGLPEVE